MTPTPVGMRCPECAQQKTRVQRPRAVANRSGVGALPSVTKILVAINVVVFLAEIVTGTGGFSSPFGTVYDHAALFGPLVADGEYWRLLTAGFLHNGIIHIALNMWILWVLGRMVEPALGPTRFGVLYITSLLCGSFGALLVQPDAVSAGASGAIFGLMGAAIPMMRSRGIDLMQSGVLPMIALNLVFTFAISNISIGAHVGGLIGGFVAGWLLDQAPRYRGAMSSAPVAACVALAVVAVAGSIAVV